MKVRNEEIGDEGMTTMPDGLSIGWSTARAQNRRRVYRRILGFNMLLHLVIGLACMFVPEFVSRTFGLPSPVPSGWIRGWGATLILVTALYIPGLQDPIRSRTPNFIGILGRVWMATVWLVIGGGFVWFGLFDLFFAILLAVLYNRLLQAELMSRP
jgi:hypothetical protein